MTNRPVSPYDYPEVMKEFGVDLTVKNVLGAVLLKVETPNIDEPTRSLLNEWSYSSENPAYPWVKGVVWDANPHVTLIYGLTSNPWQHKVAIYDLLDGVDFMNVQIDHMGMFPSSIPNEPYKVLVAHVRMTPGEGLVEANRRLRFLPHIDSYPEYRAHLTVAYLREDAPDGWLAELEGQVLTPIGLDFGERKPWEA